MKAENQALKVKIVIKDVITQGDLERFEAEYYKIPTPTRSSNSSALVKSAIKAGWIEINGESDIEPGVISDWDPRAVKFIGEEVAKIYKSFSEIPKN